MLTIRTSQGKYHESEYEKLKKPVDIDSVYGQIEFLSHLFYERDYNGIRFFINTKTSDVDTNYFCWDLESAHKFNGFVKKLRVEMMPLCVAFFISPLS